MNRIALASTITSCLLFAGVACDADTGGAIVPVALSVQSLPEPGSPLGVFTTDTGWDVVLTDARIELGSFYAFAKDAIDDPFASLLGPSIARAHGGIDPLSGRRVRAQYLEPVVVDALVATESALGTILAEAGELEVAEVRLTDPNPANAAALHGGHLYVAGTATKDATSVDFAGAVTIPDEGTSRRIEGIAIDGSLASGTTIELSLEAARFFGGVHFDEMPVADPMTGIRPIAPGSQPYAAIGLGLRNPRAYAVALTETP